MLQRLLYRGDATALELSRGERVLQIHATKPADTRSLVLKTILRAHQRLAELQGRVLGDRTPRFGDALKSGISLKLIKPDVDRV